MKVLKRILMGYIDANIMFEIKKYQIGLSIAL